MVVWSITLVIIAICSALAGYVARRMVVSGNFNRILVVILVGFLPTTIIVAILIVCHVCAKQQQALTPDEGFMSPLLLILYGFPYFLLNFVANMVAAFKFGRKP